MVAYILQQFFVLALYLYLDLVDLFCLCIDILFLLDEAVDGPCRYVEFRFVYV